MQIPRADAYPDFPPVEGESTTITPTTTGTVRGELQRLSAPSRTQLGQPMSDQDVRNALDAALTFGGADITLNMGQLGADEFLRKLGAQEAAEAREGLRYTLRAANREPLKGPQDPAERADLIKAASGVPSKFKTQLDEWLGRNTPTLPEVEEGGWPPGTESWAEKPPQTRPGWRAKLPKKKGLLDVFKAEASRSPATESFGDAHTDPRWKDFEFRRDMQKLGWTPKDFRGVSRQRLLHTWNTGTPNTGQAWKWRAIEEGRVAENARRTAANAEGVHLTAQAKYLNDLRDQAVRETLDYPLEEVRPGEGPYPLVPEEDPYSPAFKPPWERKPK